MKTYRRSSTSTGLIMRRRNRPDSFKTWIGYEVTVMETVEYEKLPKYEIIPNVQGRVLLNSEQMTFFIVEIPPGKSVPMHSHPHEQMGICLAGEAEFTGRTEKRIVRKGMVYRLAPNEEHEVRTIGPEKSVFLDVFSPPRTEYVTKQRSIEGHMHDCGSPPVSASAQDHISSDCSG
ncbi:cupin domain-containing protein [Candidatus Bathyarchaeota archaeon]|nr:cupin domain-containing protein [Candidatus Bathyarchaeota archaeon]